MSNNNKNETISLKRIISNSVINDYNDEDESDKKTRKGKWLLSKNTYWIVKSIWLLCLIVSIGLCIFLIVLNIRHYQSQAKNVITSVEIVDQDSMTLPVVTVCNLNPLLTDQAFQYIADYYLKTYNATFTNYTEFYDLLRRDKISNDLDWLLYRTFEPSFNKTLRKSFGLTELLWCQLNNSNCNTEEFNVVYHAKYGNCIVFNSGLKWANREESGIEMSVFMGVNDVKKSYVYEEFNKGIVVLIDDQKSIALDKEGIILKSGLLANIGLKKSKKESYQNCYDDLKETQLSHEMRLLNMSYDRRNCLTMCRQKAIIEQLGCYDMRYPRLFNSSIPSCSDKSVFRRLDSIEVDSVNCSALCPLECTKTSFDWDITYGEYPSYAQFLYLNRTNDGVLARYFPSSSNSSSLFADLKSSCAHFVIYFDHLSITKITQSPAMNVFDLIADIGGILSLIVGISLLSLIEIIETMVNISQFVFSRFNEWKKRHVISNKKSRKFKVRSALDAFYRIFATNRIYLKVIWSVLILTALALCIWMIINSLIVYFDYRTKSLVRKSAQPKLTFPSLSICDSNYFKSRAASEYMTSFLYNSVGANFSNFQQFYDFTNDSIYSILAWKFYETFSPQFNDTLRRSFGYSLDELVIKCEFDSRPCNMSWFDWYYHPFYGNCYKFNSGYLNGVPNSVDILTIDRPNTGLYMELFRGLPDDYYNFYFYEGKANALYMSISDQNHLPLDKFGRSIKVGTATSLGLSMTQYHSLPEPYNNCQHTETINSELAERMKQSNMSYDQHNCMTLCSELLNYNEIGCYSMSLPNIYNLSQCSTQSQFWARYNELPPPQGINNDCTRMCPSECERTSYDARTLSYCDFPSRNYASKLLDERRDHFVRLFNTENITYDMFAKSVTSLRVFFEDELVLTDITQSPVLDLVDLLSMIGGYLGLFIGMSVLSFVDLTTNVSLVFLGFINKERK